MYKRINDRNEIKLLKNVVKEGNYVIDIGANVGFYSTVLSRLVGDKGKVYSFEPDKTNFSYLSQTTNNFKNIIILNKAISDSDGYLTLYISDKINVDHKTYKPDSFINCYKVQSLTIDKFVNNRFRVNLIKMDIQGAEYYALKGMINTLRLNKGIILIMEFWPIGLKKNNITYKNFLEIFNKLKMKVYILNNGRLNELRDPEKRYKYYSNYDFDNWIISREKPKIN